MAHLLAYRVGCDGLQVSFLQKPLYSRIQLFILQGRGGGD